MWRQRAVPKKRAADRDDERPGHGAVPGDAEPPATKQRSAVPGDAEPPATKQHSAAALDGRGAEASPSPPEQRPWAVLAVDVETHGWLDSTTRQPNHRGQFGKLRWGNVRDNLGFARVVQIGWCVFAANGDVLERMELCISDAPPCQQRAVDVHGLADAVLAERGMPLADVLRQFSVALRRLRRDGGLLVAHLLEYDAGLLEGELQRVGAVDDAALLTELATEGVCTMQAASVQQECDPTSRTEAELRAPGFGAKWHVALSPACQMYGVSPPAERGDGSRFHQALFDAEMAGRLYFAMRGIRYRVPVRRVLRRLHSLSTSSASPLRVPARTGD